MRRLAGMRLLAVTGALVAVAGGMMPVRAQDSDDLKRGVARISMINGDVSVRRGDPGEWVAGVINAPLMTDDHVATGPNSRAEVQFDASNVLRLGANAEFRLSQLEYGRYQMELTKGLMTYRMLRTTDGNIEIDTPSLSVRPARQGSFRIAVNDNGETEVTARNGDVEVFTPRGSQWVRNGQTLVARGTSADAEFQVVAAGGLDEWDRWCDSRDRNISQSLSSRYVGPGVYGAEDMDAYGSWTSVPEYGNVWHPAVGPDWAPYQSGRWAWEDWYGWTWVSYDPWGWAPYHYGRWFHHDRWGWCWYPGLMTSRHYWSPALVGFFGFGNGGVGVGFGFGHMGWVALAPFEVFHPWWGRGSYGQGGFNRSINITNVNVTNIYRNSGYHNAVSAVAAGDFRAGRFGNVARYSGHQIGNVGAIHGQMPFTGGSGNMRFSDRQAVVVPRSNPNTRVFAHQQPNPVQRGGFGGGSQGPATRAQNMPQGAGNGDANGWRRFGQAGGGQANPAAGSRNGLTAPGAQMQRDDRPSASPQGNSNGGWQRFGTPNSGGSQGQRPSTAPSRQEYRSNPGQGSAPGPSRQESLRLNSPVVRERPSYNGPSYSAPRQSAPSYSAPRQSAPGYSAPRQSAPSYSAPRQSAPSNSAPRSSGGGGGSSAPRGNSGGGNSGGGHSGRR